MITRSLTPLLSSLRRTLCTASLEPESRFGIGAFLFLQSPIKGVLKSSPSDFEVTEILSDGQLAVLTSQSFDALKEEPQEDQTIRATPTTKGEFIAFLDPPDEDAARAVEGLWDFIETQRVNEHEVAFAKYDILLPSFANKAVRAQLYDYIISRGLQFGLRQAKEINGLRVFVPSIEYVEIHRVLAAPAAREVIRLGNKPSFADSPVKLELNASHLRNPRPTEELLAQLGEVRDVLKRWHVLSVGLIDGGHTLLVRFNHQVKPPASELKYLGFVCRKENVEHKALVSQVATHLSIMPNCVTFHGIKDKRAVTSQLMCVRFLRKAVQPELGKNPKSSYEIAAKKLLNLLLDSGKLEVGNFHILRQPLSVGGHEGNRFRVRVQVSVSEMAAVCERARQVALRGFPNYFGMQRFGYEMRVGQHILQGEWLDAANALLAFRTTVAGKLASGLRDYRKKQRRKTNEAGQPAPELIEASTICERARTAEEAEFAFRSVSHQEMSFFVVQMQSLFFNHLVSRRLERFGCRVLVGDFVGANLRVDAENISQFSIFDVLLPLPHSHFDPSQWAPEMRALLQELCEEFSVSLPHFAAKLLFNRSVTLRRFLVRPLHMSAEGEGQSSALLAFELPKGCYATMVLREVLGLSPTES